ncbi:hypothetical protein [Endozoicomonas atrinae]|uniref:hypothetical protein n=1 Tax=Endozoicomonas atrinae TaxID=1333660 RepID=UPI000826690B|nr:hypothetical protein [Endozoicomonas atrinae]
MSIHTKSLPQHIRFEEQEILDADILRLNSVYFLKLREMAKEDPQTASVIFGCKPELVQAIAEASVDTYQSIISAVVVQFKPSFDQSLMIDQLKSPSDAKGLEPVNNSV